MTRSRPFAALKTRGPWRVHPVHRGLGSRCRHIMALLRGMPAAGADLIEIGMPFTDPMADGPIVQAAGKRALKAGVKVRHVLTMVREFRREDDATPIILMGYLNPVLSYGTERFCVDAAAAGVDGLIMVDLPHRGGRHAGAAGHRARHRHHPPGRADHRRRGVCRWC